MDVALQILRWLYVVSIARYAYLTLLALALLTWKGLRSLARQEKVARLRAFVDEATHERLARWFHEQELFNSILAITSTAASVPLAAALPVPAAYRWLPIALVLAFTAYAWGFTRAANIGGHSGTLGALIGLGWLAWSDPTIVWWDSAPALYVLNVLAHFSGWLGATVGRGPRREAVAVSVVDVDVPDSTTRIELLQAHLRNTVRRRFAAIAVSGASLRPPPSVVLTEDSGRACLVDLDLRERFRSRTRPQREIVRWFRNIDEHSVNEIVDTLTMVHRFTDVQTRIRCVRRADGRTALRALIASFHNTSTIHWVDTPLVDAARNAHRGLVGELARIGLVSVEPARFGIVRRWAGEPTLEQHAKATIGSQQPLGYMRGMRLVRDPEWPAIVLDGIFEIDTVFDRLRGSRVVFVAGLIGNILAAMATGWLSELIAP